MGLKELLPDAFKTINHKDHNALHNGHKEYFHCVHSASIVFIVVKKNQLMY